MIFRRLNLRRFKRIPGEVNILLRPGVNVLRGDNNSGKTSSIEGLTLAVTGYAESNLADFVNDSSGAKTYEIETDFVEDGADYALYLQAGVERTKKTLSRNGELLAEGATAVNEILGTLIDTDLALYGSIALQHRTTSVIFDDAAPRLQRLKSVLGMDTVSKAVELLKARAKTCKDNASEARAVLKTLQAMRFDDMQIPESQEDPQVIDRFQEAQKAYEEYLKLREEHVKAIAAVDQKRQEFEKARQAHDSQCRAYKKAQDAVASKASLLASEKVKLVAIADVQPLETEERTATLRIQQIQSEIVSCETKLKLIASGKCSQCAQDYIGDPLPLQKQIEELRSELQVLQPRVKVLSAEIKTLRAAYVKNQQVQAVIQQAQVELEKLRKELQALPEPGDAPTQEPLSYPPPPEFDTEGYRALETRARAYRDFEREVRAALDFNLAQEKQRLRNAADIALKTAELEELTQAQTVAEKSRGLLEKEFSAYLLESGLAFVEKRMNEFFARFSDHRVSIKRDHKSVEFFFSSGDGQFTPAVLLGGAYRQILSMAFRLALCALQGSEFIILDEVDASTTESNSARLFANAVAFAPGVKQWIIVTHRQDTVDMLVSDFGAHVVELRNGEVVR